MCSQSHQTLNSDLIHIVWLLHTHNDNRRHRCRLCHSKWTSEWAKDQAKLIQVQHLNIYYSECSMINWHFIFRFCLYLFFTLLYLCLRLYRYLAPIFKFLALSLSVCFAFLCFSMEISVLDVLSACLHQCKHLFLCHTVGFQWAHWVPMRNKEFSVQILCRRVGHKNTLSSNHWPRIN